jgi:hypothetical protein
MAGITTYLSMTLTLNVRGLNSSVKRHHLANWIKRKLQQSVVYRRPISLTEISTGLEQKATRRFTKTMATKHRQE